MCCLPFRSLSDGCLTGLAARSPKLHSLCLYRNGLRDRADALACVRQLPKLRELWASGNALTSLPTEIGELGRLEILDLSGNSISSLPSQLGRLTSLRMLGLRGNPCCPDLASGWCRCHAS